MSKKDLSEEQVFDNILSLSAFTSQRHIIYLYTLILDDHKILFSASRATSEERQSGEKLSFYFDHYDDVDPRVVDIFKAKKNLSLNTPTNGEHFVVSIFLLTQVMTRSTSPLLIFQFLIYSHS